MSKSQVTTVALQEANYIREAVHEGKTIRLYARPVDVSLFPGVSTFYTVPVTRGEKKGELETFITVDDYLANKPVREGRKSNQDKVLAMRASGASDSEILAALFPTV